MYENEYYDQTHPRKKRQSSITLCLAIFGIISILFAGAWIWQAVKSPNIGWEGVRPIVIADPITFKDCQYDKDCYLEITFDSDQKNYRRSEVKVLLDGGINISYLVFRIIAISLAVLTILGGILLIVGVGFPTMGLYAFFVIIGIIQILLLLVLIALFAVVIMGVKGQLDKDHENEIVIEKVSLLKFTWLQFQITKEFLELYSSELETVFKEFSKEKKEITPSPTRVSKDIPFNIDVWRAEMQETGRQLQEAFDTATNIIMGHQIAAIVICLIYLLLQIALMGCACRAVE